MIPGRAGCSPQPEELLKASKGHALNLHLLLREKFYNMELPVSRITDEYESCFGNKIEPRDLYIPIEATNPYTWHEVLRHNPHFTSKFQIVISRISQMYIICINIEHVVKESQLIKQLAFMRLQMEKIGCPGSIAGPSAGAVAEVPAGSEELRKEFSKKLKPGSQVNPLKTKTNQNIAWIWIRIMRARFPHGIEVSKMYGEYKHYIEKAVIGKSDVSSEEKLKNIFTTNPAFQIVKKHEKWMLEISGDFVTRDDELKKNFEYGNYTKIKAGSKTTLQGSSARSMLLHAQKGRSK